MGVRVDVNGMNFFGSGVELGGQGGCEHRIEFFVKIQKIYFWGVGGGQGGCERRIEAFVKIKKKIIGGGSGRGRGGFGYWG